MAVGESRNIGPSERLQLFKILPYEEHIGLISLPFSTSKDYAQDIRTEHNKQIMKPMLVSIEKSSRFLPYRLLSFVPFELERDVEEKPRACLFRGLFSEVKVPRSTIKR